MKPLKSLEDIREALNRDVIEAAQSLLGAVLVRGDCSARIVETEAYRAEGDPGSHAFRGPTPRNLVMFGPPGFAYVYFTYGMHWMLNVVAHEEGRAAAVLIRAAEPLAGIEIMRERRPKARRDEDLLSGPGKICWALDIAKAQNGVNLLDPLSDLKLVPGKPVTKILSGTRIGLAKGKGDDLPWRFVDAHSLRFVSKPHPSNR